MAANKSSKAPKRKARIEDREFAAELVQRYMETKHWRLIWPGGPPDGGGWRGAPIDEGDLVAWLAYFAKHGTFARKGLRGPAIRKLKQEILCRKVEKLHAEQRITYKAAIASVAESAGVSTQTIADAMYGRKPRIA
jgi:hypothetical protein